MITSLATVKASIADQEGRASCKFNALQWELLDVYVKLFNLELDTGVRGEEPVDILKDIAEFYARKGKLEGLKKPVLRHFYACVQYWCREAWKQGAAKANSRREHESHD